jgi:hypothetical protein
VQVRIDLRWALRFVLVGAGVDCARAPATAVPDFRGIYVVGHDRSAFRPCGIDEDWYVALTPASAGFELRRRTETVQIDMHPAGMRNQAPAGADAGGLHRAYVEVQGDTIALTGGPEVGRYTRELRPTRVLSVRRVSRTECP